MKIFRMFKTLNEIKLIIELVKEIKVKEEKLTNILELCSRTGFGVFGLFDNLSILSSLKLLKLEVKILNTVANIGWFLAQALGLLKNLIEICKFYKNRKDQTVKYFYFLLINKNLEVITRLGDMIISSNGFDLAKTIIGKNFNEGIVSAAGLISAIIAVYLQFLKNFVNFK